MGLSVILAQASFGGEKTPKGILTGGDVVSLHDAVCHLVGKKVDFRKGGTGWYKPTTEGMFSITGALTFLHVMLTGKVHPRGKFKDVVPVWHLSNPRLQAVCFDLPIPYGITYYTHAMGFEPSPETPCAEYRMRFFRIRLDRWDCRWNYDFPVIVGGPEDDAEEQKAIFSSRLNVHLKDKDIIQEPGQETLTGRRWGRRKST